MKAERPIARYLESPTDEAQVAGMWAKIRARRERDRERASRPRWPIAVGVGASVAIAAAVALALWPRGDEVPPLATATGELPSVIEAGEVPRSVRMADGSTVELSVGARLETIENDDGRFATLLSSGVVRFSVTPGGPRRWIVESGLATVEVIGTVFTVARSDAGVRVAVERGVVLVRGERVPDRVARLTRGQEIFVAREAPSPPLAANAARSVAAAGAPGGGPREPAPSGVALDEGAAESAVGLPAAPDATGGGPAAQGEARAAGVEPGGRPRRANVPRPLSGGSSGSETPRSDRPPDGEHGAAADREHQSGATDRGAGGEADADLDRLLERADDARRAGDLATAVRLLRRVATRDSDPRAALAAFTLGRLEMDERHDPAAAREAFRRALALGLPERLAQQARLRLAEIGSDPEEPTP